MACKYSLIIPVYQVKDYIVECLESIFCQIPADVQVILVDDGSTDGSGEICDEYAKRYPQIEVIHQENKGVAAARNAGLDAAKGEYLLWVDPDDWVTENWFRAIDQIVSSKNPDILVFDYFESDSDTDTNKKYGREPGKLDKEILLYDVVRDIRINSSLWNKVMRKSLYDGILFDEQLRCLEDYALLHWLIIRAEHIEYHPGYLYYYRIRKSGLVRTLNLNVSYQSYLVALQRKADVNGTGRMCDIFGCILQAKGMCKSFILGGCPREYEEQYQECRNMIKRNLLLILKEKELPIIARIKCCILSLTIFKELYSVIKYVMR